MNRRPCGGPEQREGDDRDGKLEGAASGPWLAILGKDLQPALLGEKGGLIFGSLRVFVRLARRGNPDFLALAAARRFDHRIAP
ncbi:hypothetical protein GCM10008012_20740 [Rhizobium anhuiense]|nr:hypothetical protein GCM10008012_20740 [Rhizobium anhuiense]